jgi:hypothetical protein
MRYDLAPVFNGIEQSVKSHGSEGNGLAFVEEAARVSFDAELAELEDARLRGAHAFVSGISEVFRKLQGHSKDFPCAWERIYARHPPEWKERAALNEEKKHEITAFESNCNSGSGNDASFLGWPGSYGESARLGSGWADAGGDIGGYRDPASVPWRAGECTSV